MMRSAILFLLFLGLLLLMAPFVVSSFLIDQRGVLITGHVTSKDERVLVHYSNWTRVLEVKIQYDPPQESTVAFLTAKVSADRFDRLKQGDVAPLRYLRREDTPHIPGATFWRKLHMLPTVHLADQRSLSRLQIAFQTRLALIVAVILVVVMLIVWRIARIPFFAWAVGAFVFIGIAAILIHDFPVPTPAPKSNIRRALGTVNSVERVEWLLRGSHEEGFKADQPIEITGVQFTPAGRTEPVLAVDLIDAGSIPRLQEHSTVKVDYEAGAPRTAYILGASRQFARRNLRGIATELGASLAVVVILLLAGKLLGRGYRRLLQQSSG